MAVALPQPDPQDRLRVLSAAAELAHVIAPKDATRFASEGAQLESELIANGERPAVSILASGAVDCATAATFVEAIPAAQVNAAEESILGALSSCPQQTLEPARSRIQAGAAAGVIAPRALLAIMERTGVNTPWSEQQFASMFGNLPSDAERYRADAPNFAAMFADVAPQIDSDSAKSAGLEFLDWLGKLKESGARSLAVNISTDALKKILGSHYDEALATDVVAQSVARDAGQPAELERAPEESVSVLNAMQQEQHDANGNGADELKSLPPSLRARQAAADGFAAGTSGKKVVAARYFDVAFSAADESWAQRSPDKDVVGMLQEVSEAAANVDPTDALQRAQHLQDPAAQAISMLAVARVVVGQSE